MRKAVMARCKPLLALMLAGSAAAEVPALPPVSAPACRISAGSGEVDFGRRGAGEDRIAARSIALTIGCSLAGAMALRISGPARGEDFSWGSGDSSLRIVVSRARLDGSGVELQRLDAGGARRGEATGSLTLSPGEGLMPVRHGAPLSGRLLSLELALTPAPGERDRHPARLIRLETGIRVTLLP